MLMCLRATLHPLSQFETEELSSYLRRCSRQPWAASHRLLLLLLLLLLGPTVAGSTRSAPSRIHMGQSGHNTGGYHTGRNKPPPPPRQAGLIFPPAIAPFGPCQALTFASEK